MPAPHVVIVGGGFGGLEAAKVLADTEVRVTLVDRTNHHLFQPLLYQVATATLPPTDITAPIRWLLRNRANVGVIMAEVTAIDPARREVRLDRGEALAYDFLILAAGARHSYFSHPEWEPIAPGLKSMNDALEIRRRFLLAFERAERTDDASEREAELTFVVVGGGPTGVELAGMIPTIARRTLRGEFRRSDPATARVILVEAGPRILPTFPEGLAAHAADDLRDLGVDVRVNTMVGAMGDGWVEAGGERIAARTVIWAAGNAASPLARDLGVPLDRAGRAIVGNDLSVPGHPEVFVIGDLAAMTSRGEPVPGVAQGAIQSGRVAARNVLHTVRREGREHFTYWDKGNLATIGRNRAIADFGRFRMAGRPAWWFWLLLHIMYLAGFRNRLSVLIEWAYSYFTYQRGARLITAADPPPASESPITPRW